jgi:hypothetical protein
MSTEITRELLQTTPLADLPGWEARLFLISYPPGADANNHSHPVVGVGFVPKAPWSLPSTTTQRRHSSPAKVS